MTSTIRESLIVKACIEWLYVHGLQPIRNNTGAFQKTYTNKFGIEKTHHIRAGKKGSGDIIACTKKGRWLEVECKSAKGKQEPEQVLRQQHIERLGGLYILARSQDDLEKRRGEILG